MSYKFAKYSKEELEENIKYILKDISEECDVTKGYMSKTAALDVILGCVYVEEVWNEVLDCPATNFTPSENIGFRYHLYSPSRMDVIYNPMKKEEALKYCEKVLNGMFKNNLVVFSKSGKGVKYVG